MYTSKCRAWWIIFDSNFQSDFETLQQHSCPIESEWLLYTPPIKRKVLETIQKFNVKLLKIALEGFTKYFEVDVISNDSL